MKEIILGIKDLTFSLGSASLWMNQGQMVLLEAYIAIVENYAAAHNLSYPMNGPVFVNKFLRQYKPPKRVLDWSLVEEIGNLRKFHSHNPRKMFGTYIGVSKSLILRQAGALAACHR